MLTHLLLALLPLLALTTATHQNTPHKRHHKAKKHFDLHTRNQTETETDVVLVERDLVKRSYTGTGTYFYVGGQAGACGQMSVDSQMMVALNSNLYGSGYPGPHCFQTLTIQANGVTVSGVQIRDECPSCPNDGDLDLSPGLFQRFAGLDAGVVTITWWFEGGSDSGGDTTTSSSVWVAPTSTWTPDPTTSTWVAPTSTWTPPTSTSTWVAPTSTTPTSTWVAPSSTSTSTSTSTSPSYTPAIASSSFTSSSISVVSTTSASANPFAVVSSVSANSTEDATATATASAASTSDGTTTSGTTSKQVDGNGNLAMFNGLVTNYGQMVVIAAGGRSA